MCVWCQLADMQHERESLPGKGSALTTLDKFVRAIVYRPGWSVHAILWQGWRRAGGMVYIALATTAFGIVIGTGVQCAL